ncbi:hypothetical protein VOLCADRAFT_61744 [Volvox carteri f. nagariensis]|uniref:FAM50A/XAP5 C-terminal domain-containing protein n=1 Tax=Volvox carteri f. nagariensis TaxID=3068 RepID=D8TZI0_VOLCA|nr:uncharacterized protein VOLCADRAFT_61744 [Volvox carteri f. nagariensis]EFJ47279.1 hypothetical protein VOLCADRAFT_61744 [Volvox carteri f. nagariensis]|eukprot:XP_002951828.1 hypothetical protein VOLCADRAFT_61744 [Volvox carteri f. nagariensis]
MFNNGYVGTGEDVQRIRRMEKQREEQRKKFEALQKQTKDQADAAGLRQFGASTEEALEHAFKNETVGLVTKAEFIQKRTTLQERLEEEHRRKAEADEDAASREREKRKRAKEARKPKLSFLVDEDGGDGEEGDPATAPPPPPPFAKFGKDPTVATDFLPDKDRERLEAEMRAALRKEWQLAQDAIKSEPLAITYSYWNGTGHRRNITIKKGDSIGNFLKAVREQLAPEFRELRHVGMDNLMYIKEDLIMPHHHTFYDLIVNKARGKSGPLFDFSVREDIRVTNDATQEKQDSHAGKVVERHWYDKNKHIFPASRWEIYDPEKKYGEYTIFG